MTNRPSSLAAELSRNGSSNNGGRVNNDSAAKQLGSTQDMSNSNDDYNYNGTPQQNDGNKSSGGHNNPSTKQDKRRNNNNKRRNNHKLKERSADHRNTHDSNNNNCNYGAPNKSNTHDSNNINYNTNGALNKIDEKLSNLSIKDPRGNDPNKRITSKGKGRNTESFDPQSTIVRPDVRVWVGSRDKKSFDKPLKHDDVVIVPELFGDEDDWSIYYKLVEEMDTLQKENARGSEYISWHEGAHLIVKNPKGSPTFERIIDRLCEYFNIQKKSSGTRFNLYRDSSDWKPFHHDSAAYNEQRAKSQNITVGVSFGAMRELAFLHAASPQNDGQEKMKLYFPQQNNGVFTFGRDVNIKFKHGINALPEEEQDGKGRISIILWGLANDVKEEDGSPLLLGSDGKGPHAKRHDNRYGGRGNRNGRGRR